MITLEVDGLPYRDFTEARISYAIDSLTRSFQFLSTNVPVDGKITFPFSRGDACVVKVDGERVLTGHIETIEGRGSARAHILRVSGRGKTADVLDCNLYSPDELNAENLTIAGIIRSVLQNVGLDIEVVDTVNPPPFNSAEDLITPEQGMPAFSLIEQYSRKRQVLISENEIGNIEISNSTPTPANFSLINLVENPTNNVINYNFTQSDVNLFKRYIIVGAQDAVTNALAINRLAEKYDIAPLTFQTNAVAQPVIDERPSIRSSRQFVAVMNEGYSTAQCGDRARWEKKIRVARASGYSVTTNGYRDVDGALLDTNTVIAVQDEYADIDRTQLINSIEFSYSKRGSITTLGLLEPDAYVTAIAEPGL